MSGWLIAELDADDDDEDDERPGVMYWIVCGLKLFNGT